MRFVVVGAGAIGGVIAGRLLQAGYDVTAVARGPHLLAIQQGGLLLQTPTGSWSLPLPAIADASDFSWSADDVVILAVKSQDTEAALRSLAAVAPPSVLVVCAQ